jgi:uncharacterized protein (UPF0276 family)
MDLQFAVNYCTETADLLRAGHITFDRFKCAAWPDMIVAARQMLPIYVHFPLAVGAGIGGAIDHEREAPADWAQVDAMLVDTGTPMVNLHLTPTAEDHPDIPEDTRDPVHIERVIAAAVADVCAVIERYGRDRVIVENGGIQWRPSLRPELIRGVIEGADCGFLFDLSHARLAARLLGIEFSAYVDALPVERIREIHVTGIQPYAGRWLERSRQVGVDEQTIARYAGQFVDHLPMTEADWPFADWVMQHVREGAPLTEGRQWGYPWVVTFEYGGEGPWFKAVTDLDALREQIPRLHALIKGDSSYHRPSIARRPVRL